MTECDISSAVLMKNVIHVYQSTIFMLKNDKDPPAESFHPSSPAFHRGILTCTFFSLLTFLVSSITKNYSQVDKLWSILPVIYTWYTVVDERTFVMASLVTIWGIRLTWNFHRRGGYQWPYLWRGEEDYRWEVVRKGHYLQILTNPIIWILFNLFFISLFQNILLFLITAPAYVVHTTYTDCKENYMPLQWFGVEGILVIVMMFLIVMESIADNQQYAFQKEKSRHLASKCTDEGFCQKGLFAYMRKPNYAAEQAIWVTVYFFSIRTTDVCQWFNWSIIGSILLILLFQRSASLTEWISNQKYPNYSLYQKRVPLFIPKISNAFRYNKHD